MNRRGFLGHALLLMTAPLVGASDLRTRPVNRKRLRGYWIVERPRVVDVNWIHTDHTLTSITLTYKRSKNLHHLELLG